MAMANDKEGSGGLEWRVTAPSGSSVKMESESGMIGRAWTWFAGAVLMVKSKVFGFGKNAWKMGVDDPRKVIHGIKVGIALSLVSIFYYTRPLYDGVGGNAMWAVMTVAVIFEYTVGGSLYKGFNRAVATLSAGGLAVGIHWIASKTGGKVEPVILSASVFLLGAAATFSRFIPTIKARFDYGVTIFILTFSLVAVSGYRVDELLYLAQQRMSTIAIGISICLLVCILICPVWASEELHLLITRNMEKLADSLEGCLEEYFMKDGAGERKNNSCSQKSQGYRCVLNSKASEDSQANLARWEPAHGCFGFRHPWSQYLKVGSAMRYCAYCIEALNGCINSEIQAPESTKKHLGEVCMKLSSQSSKILKELSISIKSMKRSQSIDLLVEEMSNAVEELRSALRSFPNQLAQAAVQPAGEATEEKKHSISVTATLPVMEVLPLITVASLLIEISARIDGVVHAVHTLADLAGFESVEKEKPLSPTQQEQEDMKAFQEV